MGKVILTDELRAALNGMKGEVEVCEPDGRIVGHFVPHERFVRDTYEWAKTTAFTDEELDRASRESGGRTLAEIKKSWGWA